jgi:hypothetical protein
MNKDIVNLYATTMIDGGEIRKCFINVCYPPASFPGGIPKVIISDEELSEQEIGDTINEMAAQNAKLIYEAATGDTGGKLIEGTDFVAFTAGSGKTNNYNS